MSVPQGRVGRRRRATQLLACAVAGLLWCGATLRAAEVLPIDPAGRMQDDLRRGGQMAPPQAMPEPAPSLPPPAPAPAPALAGKVVLSEVVFSRSELLSETELQALARPYLGRPVGSDGLNALLRSIQALYLSKGIETAVPVLPQQDLNQGSLHVLLLEGRLGAVRVDGAIAADRDWIGRWFDVQTGTVIHPEAFARRLGVFNAASDYQAQMRFVPGEAFGRSDLEIRLPERAVSQFWSALDAPDLGSGNTDRASAYAGYRLYPVGVHGGRLDVMTIANASAHTLSVSAGMPLGQQGWRLGLSLSDSRSTSTVASTTGGADLSIDGASSASALELGRYLVVSGSQLVHLTATLARLGSSSTSSGEVLTDRRIDRFTLAAAGDWATRLPVSGLQSTSWRAALTRADAPAGSYGFVELGGAASWALTQPGSAELRVQGLARLAARDVPDATDYWMVGGSNSVRGFDAGAAYGVRGYAVQAGLYQPVVLAGVAAAQAYLSADQGSAVREGIETRIASVSIGLQAQLGRHWALDTAVTRQTAGLLADPTRWSLRLSAVW